MAFTEQALRWLETVFFERFGNNFNLIEKNNQVVMTLEGHEGQILFPTQDSVFHQSISNFPSFQWNAKVEGFDYPINEFLPAPGSVPLRQPLIDVSSREARIHYDIPGLTFWMLSRREEIGRTDLDSHQRFPAISSHAFRHDYLDRPIIDEWLAILGQVIQRVWPEIGLKEHQFEIKVSHDVDAPARYGFQGPKGLIRTVVGDVLLHRSFKSAVIAPWVWLNSRHQIHPLDPANTFDWLMAQSESHGLASAFYFICGRTNPAKDAHYELEFPSIRKLMREIHRRGHEIGLHPSYDTYKHPELIRREAESLKRVCDEEGIQQAQWGGRMHFLRWDQSITLRAWEEAGLSYDSTLGYADHPGFRCGTCHEYPAFDPARDKQLGLRVRPLVAMDCTVMGEQYLGLGPTELAFQKFVGLKQMCQKTGGKFTLLWHNSYFWDPRHFGIYQRLLDS